MKILGTALLAAALVSVAVQADRPVDPQEALQAREHAAQVPFVTAQVFPGDCCNDDFRQALPMWESPADNTIAKP